MKRASLNHVYRLVWNARLGIYIPAPEFAKAKGKTASIVCGVLGLVLPITSFAGGVVVAPSSGTTQVYTAPNGVPVVDINTANSSGLSHNTFTDYNVGTQGLVLNNSTLSQPTVQTQLAGQIYSNSNLGSAATIILNEVVSPNRSQLLGFTEVAGSKADVIVANPYGITCNGCGFINTDRVTLTTGAPTISAGGALSGFTVNGGDIMIYGNGLNASAQTYFDIVTRSFKLDGQLNAKDLKIATGALDWDYATQTASASVATGTAPTLAFDSTALGGMYANRISIQATEAGVGVKMLGEAAATVDDFSINSAGQIELKGSVSAQRDVTMASNEVTNDAFVFDNAKISAGRDLNINSNDTGMTMTGGTLYAGNNMNFRVAYRFIDTANTTNPDDTDNQRYADGNLNFTVDGSATIDGTTFSSGADSDVHFGTLTLGAGGITVYSAEALDLSLSSGVLDWGNGNTRLQSNGDLTLSAWSPSSEIRINAPIVSDTGNITLNSGGAIYNNDQIIADAGTISIYAGGVLNNQDLIRAKSGISMDLGGLTNGWTDNYQAYIIGSSDGSGSSSITLRSQPLNDYGHIHSNGDLSITAPNIFIANTGALSSNANLSLGATSNYIDNYGSLFANGNMTLQAAGRIINYAPGTIYGYQQLVATTPVFRNYSDINFSGAITVNTSSLFFNGVTTDLSNYKTLEVYTNQYIFGIPVQRFWSEYQTAFNTIADLTNSSDSRNHYWVHEATYQVSEVALIDLNFIKPQFLSAGNITLNYGAGSLTNNAGIISTPATLALYGTGPVTNRELYLEQNILFSGKELLNQNPDNTQSHYASDYTQWSNTPNGWDGSNDPNWGLGGVWTWNGSCGIECGTIVNDSLEKSYKVRTGLADPNNPYSWRSTVGIFAGTLTGNIGGLTNRGAIGNTAPTGTTTPTTGNVSQYLPTNPNGYFVYSQSPSANYLIETNPLYVSGEALGSDFLIERLGLDIDDIEMRLGDAAYETYLIRQQLIDQINTNLLDGYDSEYSMVEAMYTSAVDVSTELGLTFGQALTDEQVANLDQDIVWMVETTVAGKKVLQPVVYLSQQTRSQITSGSVIAANDINLKVDSLENAGGTITAKNSMDIESRGDITNISGNISGTDVSLTSTEGSITNETSVDARGDDFSARTEIGRTGSITATNNLNLDAKEDITVLGADVSAGGDASLFAGGDVTFDTIVDKTTDTTITSYKTAGVVKSGSSTTMTTVTTEKNIGSNLTTGGNLSIKSGGDTTIAGSKADVGGDLNVDTGGDFNVIARQDRTTTHSVTNRSGEGVGGGVYGTQKITTDTFKGTNVGSTLNVGGNADVKSAGDIKLQGSVMSVAGDATLDAAEDIKILDGLDEEWSRTKIETTTYGSFEKSGNSGSSKQSSSSNKEGVAQANAGAKAEAEGGVEFNAAKKTVEVIEKGKQTSVASNLKIGGNLKAKAGETMTVQGSNVEAGGDIDIEAKDVEVLAGRNYEYETRSKTTQKVGVFIDGNADATAAATATGRRMLPSGKSEASGEGNGEGVMTAGVRQEVEVSTSQKLTHTSSSIKSGGDMSIKAENEATFQAADVESGGDMNIEAKDITNLAAEDYEVTTSSSSRTTTGAYLDANVSTSLGAKAWGSATGGGAKGESGAESEASAGARFAKETNYEEEGSTTNVVSTFKAGGNLTRKAEDTIIDQGTQLEAGGNIDQSATRLIEETVVDKEWSKSSSSSVDGRVGAYAGASAEGSIGAQKSFIGQSAGPDSDKDASAGIKAKYSQSNENESSFSGTAVTTKYKAGGNISSKTTEETKLIGTNMEAGGDISLEAGSLDYQAARDVSVESSNSQEIEGEGKAALYGSPGASLEGSYGKETSDSYESNATGGTLNAGGNITVKTTGDARFEGTAIEAGNNVDISSSEGDVNFESAKSIKKESGQSVEVSAEVSGSKDGGGAEVEGSYSKNSSLEIENNVVTIKSGGTVNINAGNDVVFEGSQVESQGDTTVNAGGDVKLLEAKDVKKEDSFSVSASASASSEEGEKEGSAETEVGVKKKNVQTGIVTQINSGGNVSINGDGVTLQGTQIQGSDVKIEGDITTLQRTLVNESIDIEAGAAVEGSSEGKKEDNDSKDTKDAVP